MPNLIPAAVSKKPPKRLHFAISYNIMLYKHFAISRKVKYIKETKESYNKATQMLSNRMSNVSVVMCSFLV